MRRVIDPSARAHSFTARRGGMRDGKKLDRRLQKVEQRVAPVRADILTPEDWSIVEEVDETPEVDEDVVGRFFLVRNEGVDDTFSAGMTAANGEPMLVGLSTIATTSGADQAMSLSELGDFIGLGLGDEPIDIAVAPSGNLHIALDDDDNIVVFNNSGSIVTSFGNLSLVNPLSLTVDRAGNTFVLDQTSFGVFNVVKFNNLNAFVSTTSFNTATYGDARSIASSQDNKLAIVGVLGSTTGKVTIWNNTPAVTSSFSIADLSNTFDIAFDIDGNIWITDTGMHVVRKYSQAGALLLEIGTGVGGSAIGQLLSPTGVEVLSNGTVMVVEYGNNRVQAFDADGVSLGVVGTFGTSGDQLNKPVRAAVDSFDIFYVADENNARISVVRFTDIGEASSYPLQEDFIGGNATSGSIGELGWKTGGNGSIAEAASTAAHPGVYTLSTGGAGGNKRYVSLGPWSPSNVQRMSFYFKLSTTLTSSEFSVGLADDPTANPRTHPNFIGVTWSSVRGDSDIQFSKHVASVVTLAAGVDELAGGWFQLVMERTGAGAWTLTLRRMADGVTAQADVTGVSESVTYQACFTVRTDNGTGKTLDVDFWNGAFSGITRV